MLLFQINYEVEIGKLSTEPSLLMLFSLEKTSIFFMCHALDRMI